MSASGKPYQRVICVGLDGATFDVIDPMVEQGRLPTLAKILDTGVRADLASTIPPLSAPAWVSFMTGVNPGKHGVFHFRSMGSEGLGSQLMGSWGYRGRTIFDYASAAGLKVVGFRVPMTFPPWPVNGTMVSGFPTPDPLTTYSEPPEIGRNIGPLVKLGAVRRATADSETRIDNFDFYIDRSTSVLVDLLQPDVGLFCYVNSITDWIAHKFWKFSDPESPGYEALPKGDSTLVEYFYERVDESLGALLDVAPSGSLIIVMSDHGMGPRTTRRFNTNAWLAHKGYLARSSRGSWRRYASKGIQVLKEKAPDKYWLWRHAPDVLRRSAGTLGSYSGAIGWSESQAYGVTIDHHVEGININLSGREGAGSVPPSSYDDLREQIIAAARQLVDPQTGATVFEGVFRREEVYTGEHSALAPDIVLTLKPAFEFGLPSERSVFSEVAISELGRSSSTHRPDGILAMSGPGVKEQTNIGSASLLDVPATIMWALGLDVPEEFDGSVLEAFDADVMAQHPVSRGIARSEHAGQGAYTQEEEKQMTEHLEDLGYM
jgi:predicted AlkP superfamily phosphohydrolase/phosphomutase